jgi:hypothetical protein
MPAIKKSPSIDTTRLAAQVKRRQAVYVRAVHGRLKVVRYWPWERREKIPPFLPLTATRESANLP